jgi:cob(I)alamin adenosyltransferase
MGQESVISYCGEEELRVSVVLGLGIEEVSKQKTVFIVRFLKETGDIDKELLEKFEPELKLFNFGKPDDLTIRNAYNFAKKVLATSECQLLILEDLLDVVNQGIIPAEELKVLLEAEHKGTKIILTGNDLVKGLEFCVDKKVWIRVDNGI